MKTKLQNQIPRLVIFDGNSIVHRAYHALPLSMTTRSGEPINAAFGFTSILLKALGELKPTYVAVAWDFPAATFRHEQYAEYKATRQKADPELYDQMPIVKEIIAALNIPLFERKGFEADDLLGTLAEQAKKLKGLDTYIVTGDKDAFQLVDDHVFVYTMKKGVSEVSTYDKKAIAERYDLSPEQLIDLKALQGDASDNIPGVAGVGEKTALKLIQAFGSLDALYKAVDEAVEVGAKQISKRGEKVAGKLFEKLAAQKKQAYLSRKLGTIKIDVPIKLDLKGATLANYDRKKVLDLFAELQFRSLADRLPRVSSGADKAPERVFDRTRAAVVDQAKRKKPSGYHLVDTEKKLIALNQQLSKKKSFAVDTETTTLGPIGCELVGLSFSYKDGEAFYVPVAHKDSDGKQCERGKALEILKDILEDKNIGKIGHNIKYDAVVLKNYGVDLGPIELDTMVANYILNPGHRQNSLDALVFAEFGHEMVPIEECIGKGNKQCGFDEVGIELATHYAAEDADFTWRLAGVVQKKLAKNAWAKKIWQEIEGPLIPVLSDMEFKGVTINTKTLASVKTKYARRVVTLKKKIHELAKGEFNINSPKQMQEVLFERLALDTKNIKKTKTGYSTAASELEKLKGTHPIIELIREYRELSKLISTYLDALPKLIDKNTGRVHTSYNQTIAATGRLSSSDPNLQNIPVRTDAGNQIRKAFIAPPGQVYLALDYSQIELRIVAHLTKDKSMVKAFKQGMDIHADTAARVLGKKPSEITKSERSTAKMMNFGVIYGLSAFGLAERTGLSRTEAQEFIDNYFSLYSDLKKYIDTIVKGARKLGYVESLFGRRRYLPELSSSNWLVRSAAERAAVNHPFQGTNADMIKMAMISIHKKLPRTKSMMIMQVHDELILEVPREDLKEIAKSTKEIMESITALRVPVKVEAKTGTNWGTLKPYDINNA